MPNSVFKLEMRFLPRAIEGLLSPFLLMVCVIVFPEPLTAQTVQDSMVVNPDSIAEAVMSPKGAFLRSAVLPGWGHSHVGATGRGAFFLTTELSAVFMVLKTQTRLSRAKDRRAFLESVMTARYVADGVEDLDAIETLLEDDETVADLRALEESRSEQREDWIALSIFFLFLSGADAYVSAHLSNFPAAVVIEPNSGGGMEIGLSIPVNF